MVNTTAKNLQLSNGAVSRSILSTAGPQIQTECQQLAPGGIAFGSVIETSGYRLPCSKVYHGACQNWDDGAGECEAVSSQHSTICAVAKQSDFDCRTFSSTNMINTLCMQIDTAISL